MKEKNKMIIAATLTIAMVGVLQMANYRNARSNNEQFEVIKTENKNNAVYQMPDSKCLAITDIWHDIVLNEEFLKQYISAIYAEDEYSQEYMLSLKANDSERYDVYSYTIYENSLIINSDNCTIATWQNYNTETNQFTNFALQYTDTTNDYNLYKADFVEATGGEYFNQTTTAGIYTNDIETIYPAIYNAIYGYFLMNSNNNNIVDTISSGLGLIPNLAQQFLAGFTGLFWNSTNSTLSGFAIFSLTFLGIAISFAIIKLVLNVIRNNTGA